MMKLSGQCLERVVDDEYTEDDEDRLAVSEEPVSNEDKEGSVMGGAFSITFSLGLSVGSSDMSVKLHSSLLNSGS